MSRMRHLTKEDETEFAELEHGERDEREQEEAERDT
jgi:hypothetical protein